MVKQQKKKANLQRNKINKREHGKHCSVMISWGGKVTRRVSVQNKMQIQQKCWCIALNHRVWRGVCWVLTRLQRKGVITVTHTQDALYSVYILQNRYNEAHRMKQERLWALWAKRSGLRQLCYFYSCMKSLNSLNTTQIHSSVGMNLLFAKSLK